VGSIRADAWIRLFTLLQGRAFQRSVSLSSLPRPLSAILVSRRSCVVSVVFGLVFVHVMQAQQLLDLTECQHRSRAVFKLACLQELFGQPPHGKS
jgi:hypothetical protein